jgi:hypothetical protein
MATLFETEDIPKALKNSHESMVTPYVSMWMEEGILYGKYVDDLHMTLEIAKYCVDSRFQFSNSRSFALLVDMRGIKSMTPEARKYMSSVGAVLVKAGALIIGSPLNRTIGNIFLTIDKPPVPLKLFTDKEKARQWLQQYL